MLQIESLSKSYGSRQLFDQISFKFNPRERVGVVGLNGAAARLGEPGDLVIIDTKAARPRSRQLVAGFTAQGEPAGPTTGPVSCPAGRSSGWRSRGPVCSGRRYCCSTSPRPASIRRRGAISGP